MRRTLLFFLVGAAMAGCSTLNHDEITAYHAPGVPEPLYARIRAHDKLSTADVVDLSNAHIRNSFIITYLSVSNSRFNLSHEDVEELRDEGVSSDIIDYMRDQSDRSGWLFSFL